MRILKKGQIVYFYNATGPFMGDIAAGKVINAKKDLLTKEVTYEVETNSLGIFWASKITLKAENIYTNINKIKKEYKEELIYNSLKKKIDDLTELFNKLMSECKDKLECIDNKVISVGDSAFNTSINISELFVNNKNVLEEIEGLKKEVDAIKKKIKPKTRKPVKEAK